MSRVDTKELSEPWAQRAWLIDYKLFSGLYIAKTRRNARARMYRIRREAALERKLEAAQRRIEYLEADLKLAQEQVAESEERREFAARLEFGA